MIIPECAGCGRCCYQVVGLVDGVDVVPEAMIVEHDGQRCMEQRGDGACVALDPVSKLCTIYAQRPNVCREFDRGGELCVNVLARAAKRTIAQALRS
jgi:Fe-S-cluster containining protein